MIVLLFVVLFFVHFLLHNMEQVNIASNLLEYILNLYMNGEISENEYDTRRDKVFSNMNFIQKQIYKRRYGYYATSGGKTSRDNIKQL